jgi:heat shock protein HslJ
MRYLFTLLSSISLLALVSGCEDKNSESVLLNTHWMLVEIEGTPISYSSYSGTYRSYIEFTDGVNRTTGQGPCNDFGGSFTLGSQPGQLTISPQSSTKIACGGLGIETKYFEALPRTVSYQTVGKELRLYDATNSTRPLLVFEDRSRVE